MEFFETSALLITFIALGKLLEGAAKGRTSKVCCSSLHKNFGGGLLDLWDLCCSWQAAGGLHLQGVFDSLQVKCSKMVQKYVCFIALGKLLEGAARGRSPGCVVFPVLLSCKIADIRHASASRPAAGLSAGLPCKSGVIEETCLACMTIVASKPQIVHPLQLQPQQLLRLAPANAVLLTLDEVRACAFR